MRSIPRDTGFTESASFVGENYGVSNRNSPSNGGIFRAYADVRSGGYAVYRGLVGGYWEPPEQCLVAWGTRRSLRGISW
jgi:hypothetical protein